ncbi:MAG: ferritin-like domain-containing protein, partial [Fimbriimonadaceae bacterium]
MERLAHVANIREVERMPVVAEALQATLVDFIAISLQSKHLHWNVFGRHFKTVHEHLDELTAVLQGHADRLAERMAAIGASPDGRAMTVTHEAW